jgi:hypothetical protein
VVRLSECADFHLLVRSDAWECADGRRLGVKADIFNVGSLRRRVSVEKHSFEFFDAGNAQAKQQREELAFCVLDAALEWLGTPCCDAPAAVRGRRSRSSWCACGSRRRGGRHLRRHQHDAPPPAAGSGTLPQPRDRRADHLHREHLRRRAGRRLDVLEVAFVMHLTVFSLSIDQVLETNFLEKVTNSPDYKDMPVDDAMVDLRCARADECDGSRERL